MRMSKQQGMPPPWRPAQCLMCSHTLGLKCRRKKKRLLGPQVGRLRGSARVEALNRLARQQPPQHIPHVSNVPLAHCSAACQSSSNSISSSSRPSEITLAVSDQEAEALWNTVWAPCRRPLLHSRVPVGPDRSAELASIGRSCPRPLGSDLQPLALSSSSSHGPMGASQEPILRMAE